MSRAVRGQRCQQLLHGDRPARADDVVDDDGLAARLAPRNAGPCETAAGARWLSMRMQRPVRDGGKEFARTAVEITAAPAGVAWDMNAQGRGITFVMSRRRAPSTDSPARHFFHDAADWNLALALRPGGDGGVTRPVTAHSMRVCMEIASPVAGVDHGTIVFRGTRQASGARPAPARRCLAA